MGDEGRELLDDWEYPWADIGRDVHVCKETDISFVVLAEFQQIQWNAYENNRV